MKCAVSLKEKEKIKKVAINKTVRFMMVAFATYMGDKRGWKPDSIANAIKWIEKFAVMISEDYTTQKEAEESLAEQYGIVFTDSGDICMKR